VQFVAVCRSFFFIAIKAPSGTEIVMGCKVLQCVAMCCNVL